MEEINDLLDILESVTFGRYNESTKELYDIETGEKLLQIDSISNFDRKISLNQENKKIKTMLSIINNTKGEDKWVILKWAHYLKIF